MKCFNCNNDLSTLYSGSSGHAIVGRGDLCTNCNSDIKCCKNCEHYDETQNNSCREPQSERVTDKERANFCDYFKLGGKGAAAAEQSKADTLKDLDSLFKS